MRALRAAGAALLLVAVAQPAQAQLLNKLKKKAKAKVEQRIERRADEGMDRALNGMEGAIACVVTDTECIEEARAQGRTVTLTDSAGRPLEGDSASSASTAGGPLGGPVWSRYDFVPGDRVLFDDDLTDAAVGDFPPRLDFRSGNMETVEWQGRRWLRAMSSGDFFIPLPETLPQRFTLEFDYTGNRGSIQTISFGDGQGLGKLAFTPSSGGIRGGGVQSYTYVQGEMPEIVTVRLMADGEHVKVYLDSLRVANVPRVELGRADRIRISANANQHSPVLYANFRVAAGGRDLYDALAADGRVATRGILFDTGSDRIRPQSTPTLKQIAAVLTEHPSLRLDIEGHTDAVGDDAANQALSEGRAEAVRRALVDQFHVDGSRLEAHGYGETRPVADNGTPEGRQQNRRVELVKLDG